MVCCCYIPFTHDDVSCTGPDCTYELLQAKSGEFTCAQRVASLRLPSGGNLTEMDACAKVADDFEECNIKECNPDTCTGGLRLNGTREKKREGVSWAWAVLCANAVFCIIIFVMYKKW